MFEFLEQFLIRCIIYFSKSCWLFWDTAQNMLIFGKRCSTPLSILKPENSVVKISIEGGTLCWAVHKFLLKHWKKITTVIQLLCFFFCFFFCFVLFLFCCFVLFYFFNQNFFSSYSANSFKVCHSKYYLIWYNLQSYNLPNIIPQILIFHSLLNSDCFVYNPHVANNCISLFSSNLSPLTHVRKSKVINYCKLTTWCLPRRKSNN